MNGGQNKGDRRCCTEPRPDRDISSFCQFLKPQKVVFIVMRISSWPHKYMAAVSSAACSSSSNSFFSFLLKSKLTPPSFLISIPCFIILYAPIYIYIIVYLYLYYVHLSLQLQCELQYNRDFVFLNDRTQCLVPCLTLFRNSTGIG